jgi:type IV secretion system protein VirB11
MVNPDGGIWIEHFSSGRRFSGQRLLKHDADRILRLLADHCGAIVNAENPRISGALPMTGERFQGQYMPVVAAPTFVIRKKVTIGLTLHDYERSGSISTAHADTLRRAVSARENILIAGGTGSGKTTFANAILAQPEIIEDTGELQSAAPDLVCLLTKTTPPVVTIGDLVRDTLRLRPDRIIIGEVRDGSALDVIKAWNTGHPGGLTTLHANSAEEALTRIDELIAEVSAQVPHRAVARAINQVVFMRRSPRGPVVDTVSRVCGWDRGHYRLEAL